jgi:hemerythrin-like domain-containing protein
MSMQSEKMTSRRGSRTRTTARRSSAVGSDAIVMLREDHKRVSAMFARYKKLADNGGAEKGRQTLAQQICGELKIHTTLEEEIFYPAARAALGEKGADLLDEAKVEHASVKDLIAQLEGASPKDDLFDAKVTVLGEYIKHHVKEEHEELFPKCRKARMDLKAIGAAMSARKKDLS